jgi:hypothetical protein
MKLTFPINTTGGRSVYRIVGTLGAGWERTGLRRMQWGRVPLHVRDEEFFLLTIIFLMKKFHWFWQK